MKFGKYAIVQPVAHTFKEEPDWEWTFKPPTAKDELELQAFIAQGRTITEKGITKTLPATPMEVTFEEIALTFGGTTIPEFKEEDGEWVSAGKPILKSNATKDAVKRVLSEMPAEMVLEIWKALGEHIPDWGARPTDPKA